ncbi:MAG: DNA adenine methylase [Armatimonadetes bacterium]|nr:DNA adenine methylase [Armatimonadota bacterium]
MVKYLGSKRRLVPAIVKIAEALPGVRTACDLFAGTTRVGQGFKRAGIHVLSNDLASYSHVLGQAYIATDARETNLPRLRELLEHLNGLSSEDGYFTETFCRRSRYFQPHNGMRIDAIRGEIDRLTLTSSERAVLLTALLLAADRVDSTTGLQMAYLKQWSPRSHATLELTLPELLPGMGEVRQMDANRLAEGLKDVDLAYIDPPYNQHSYAGNYHVWETLVRNDRPEVYGVACKRMDCRQTRSRYNSRIQCRDAFSQLIAELAPRVPWLLVSFSTEGHLSPVEIHEILRGAGHVESRAFDYKRYVGAQIGVYNPQGVKVGTPTHFRNQEQLFLVGPDPRIVRRALDGASGVIVS